MKVKNTRATMGTLICMVKVSSKLTGMLTVLLLLAGFAVLFSWHVRVGLIRYFDVDEFTYLHWVALFVQGKKPYIDFFMAFPPLFLFLFAPVVWIAGKGASFFIAARMVAIGIEATIFLSIAVLFAVMRNKRYALLPAVLIAFLPMPFDKYFELRPDNLSTLLAVWGVLFQVLFLRGKWQKQTAFLSGLFYAASLLVFPKAISFVIVAVIVWLGNTFPELIHGNIGRSPSRFFIVGGAIISIFVGIYLLLLGHFDTVWYSLTKLALETNSLVPYIMEAHLFFFPNSAWYGGNGLAPGLLLNHSLWVIGIAYGVYRLFAPALAAEGKRGGVSSEILVAGIFLLNAMLYVAYYPMKHPQYLIPIGIFVGFYAADFFVFVLSKLSCINKVIPLVILTVMLLVLQAVTQQVNTQKLGWVNTAQLNQLTQMQQMIPTSDYVFDLEGRMIFWPQPHYICCLAIGDFIRLMSRQPLPVRDVLEEKSVPYIFQGDSRRLYTLPWDDRVYIQEHYAPVPGWGDTLWKRL